MPKSLNKIVSNIGIFLIILTFLMGYVPVGLRASTDIIVHYHRNDKNYDGQNIAVTLENGDIVRSEYVGQDDYGAIAIFSIENDRRVEINFEKNEKIIDGYPNRSIDLTRGDEVWIASDSKDVNYLVPDGYTSSVVNYYGGDLSQSNIENPSLKIHYHRPDGNYAGVRIVGWEEKTGNQTYEFEGVDGFGAYVTIDNIDYSDNIYFGFVIESDLNDEIKESRYINITSTHEVWVHQNQYDISYSEDSENIGNSKVKSFQIDLAYNRYDNDYNGVTLEYYEVGNEKGLKSIPIKNNDSIKIDITATNNIKFDIYKNGVLDDYKNSVVYMSNVEDGQVIYLRLLQGTNKIGNFPEPFDDSGALIDNAVIVDDNKILVTMDRPIKLDKSLDNFKVDDLPVSNVVPLDESKGFSNIKENYKIVFELTTGNLNFTRDYKVSKDDVSNYVYTSLGDVYSTNNFEYLYTYKGDDLGLNIVGDKYTLRLWSPTAESVELYLYDIVTQNTINPTSSVQMSKAENGTWYTTMPVSENQGRFYCYKINFNKGSNFAMDPYAKYVSFNGNKAVLPSLEILNEAVTVKPFERKDPSEAIIYELSVGEFTYDEDTKISYKGKYAGLSEKGNKNLNGDTIGFDHLKDLGVTHVALLPVIDFESDAKTIDSEGYESGYGSKNFNVPEEIYSTDSFEYQTRINELKVMINELHSNDMGVILDVSYSYVENALNSNFQKIVPNYYFRNVDGEFSNGSTYGNELATERSMVRKFIIDSVVYWASEYGVDGFNFDSMQLIDIETMKELRKRLDEIDPNIMIIGNSKIEDSALPTLDQSSKENFFSFEGNLSLLSKDFNSAIRGAEEYDLESGFVTGSLDKVEDAKFAIVGGTQHPQVDFTQVDYSNFAWAKSPMQSINYLSTYGEKSLAEKIELSTKVADGEEKIKMQKLAAVFLFTSQGIPFFYSGEEIGKENKKEEDETHSISFYDWSKKTDNLELFEYYKGLIKLRKNTAAFRYKTEEEVANNLSFYDTEDGLIAYKVKGEPTDKYLEYVVIFNPSDTDRIVTLESGKFDILVNGTASGVEPIISNYKLNKKIQVPAYSAYVFGSSELTGDLVQSNVSNDGSILSKLFLYSILTILVGLGIYFINVYIEKQTSFFKK